VKTSVTSTGDGFSKLENHILSELGYTPGTLISNIAMLKAWNNPEMRGYDGEWVFPGDTGMIISSWLVGANVRMHVLIKPRDGRAKLMCFSCKINNIKRNWRIVSPL
jgi:hypothetical protein